jgi:hypothetical protein
VVALLQLLLSKVEAHPHVAMGIQPVGEV